VNNPLKLLSSSLPILALTLIPASSFTKDQIRSSGATNLPDLLRRVPGFDVYEMKPSFPLGKELARLVSFYLRGSF